MKRYPNSEKIAESYLQKEEKKLTEFPFYYFDTPFDKRIDALPSIENNYERLRECLRLQDEMLKYYSGEELPKALAKHLVEMEELALRDDEAFGEYRRVCVASGDTTLFHVRAREFFELFSPGKEIEKAWKEFNGDMGPNQFSEETLEEIRFCEKMFFLEFYSYAKLYDVSISETALKMSSIQTKVWIVEGVWRVLSNSSDAERFSPFLKLLWTTFSLKDGKLLEDSLVWECIEDCEQFYADCDVRDRQPKELQQAATEKVSYVETNFEKCIREKHITDKAFSYAGLVYGYSFEGQDLSKVDTSKITFRRCNLRNTGATVSLENHAEIYFVAGKAIDYTNLCDCIFKGCKVTGFQPENHTFSVETFDKAFLKAECPKYFIDDAVVPREMIDAIYRKKTIPLSLLLRYQEYLSGELVQRATEANKDRFFFNFIKWRDMVEKEKNDE